MLKEMKHKTNYGVTKQMQATLERKAMANNEVRKENKSLYTLLQSLETADNKLKSEIENDIVALGESIIPELILYLQNINGVVRGVIAMVLIRMGESSVSYLLNAAKKNREFDWMAKYLISEIEAPIKVAA